MKSQFLLLTIIALWHSARAGEKPPTVLIVSAHPDDATEFAVTVYPDYISFFEFYRDIPHS